MGVGAQKDLGGTKLLPEKWLDSLNFSFFFVEIKVTSKITKKKDLHWNWDGFSVRIKVTSRKKNKKRFSLKLRRFFWYEIAQNFDTNFLKKYKIAQNFDSKLPKNYKISQKFDAKLSK